MNKDHISFELLSDLYDENLSVQDEVESILDHIDSCPECSLEYERLKDSLRLVSQLKIDYIHSDNFACNTVEKYRWRKRRKLLFKSLPSVAASVLIISAVTLYQSGIYSPGTGNTPVAENKIYNPQKIVGLIGNSDGRIVKITDNYIEGEIEFDEFRKLKRLLGHNGFQKIRYSMVTKSPGDIFPNSSSRTFNWENNIENVAVGNNSPVNRKSNPIEKTERFIRFRVYQ